MGAKKSGGLVVAAALMIAAPAAHMALRAQTQTRDASGICEKDGRKLAGAAPVVVGKSGPAIRKVRNVAPNYPELPAGTLGSGPWAGEILIGIDGGVVRVWTTRAVRFTSPFPPFNRAIVDAIQQWKFEPYRVRGQATPVCLPVTISIDWS